MNELYISSDYFVGYARLRANQATLTSMWAGQARQRDPRVQLSANRSRPFLHHHRSPTDLPRRRPRRAGRRL